MEQSTRLPVTLLLPLLLGGVFFAYYAGIYSLMLYHNDIGWHLAAGDLIRAQGALPLQDPWSYTAGDHPWINLSWLWDVVISFIYEGTGFVGLKLLVAAAGAVAIGLQASLGLRMGASVPVTLLVTLISGVALPQFTPPDVFLAVTPQIVTLLMAVLFYGVLHRVGAEHRLHDLFWLPVLMVLWANLHGGFLTGFFILGVFTLDRLLAKDKPSVLALLACSAACLGAACLTPWGAEIFLWVVRFLDNPVQQSISEWQPVWVRLAASDSIVPALPAVLVLAVFPLAVWRLLAQAECHAPLILLAVMLHVQALFQIRFISLFILLAVPVLAVGLSPSRRRMTEHDAVMSVRTVRLVQFLLGSVLLLLSAALLRQPAEGLPAALWSREEIAYVAEYCPERRLLHHWNDGSFIIYQTRGAVRPFIDGRASTAYPDAVLADVSRLSGQRGEQTWDALLQKYRIEVVMWPKQEPVAARYFDRHREWQRVFTGSRMNVYVLRKVKAG